MPPKKLNKLSKNDISDDSSTSDCESDTEIIVKTPVKKSIVKTNDDSDSEQELSKKKSIKLSKPEVIEVDNDSDDINNESDLEYVFQPLQLHRPQWPHWTQRLRRLHWPCWPHRAHQDHQLRRPCRPHPPNLPQWPLRLQPRWPHFLCRSLHQCRLPCLLGLQASIPSCTLHHQR